MILADYLFIGIAVICGILGLHFGFGTIMNGLTKGIKGIIFSILVCVLLFGYLQAFAPIQHLIVSFRDLLSRFDNGFVKFLLTIRIEMLLFAVVLFVVIRIIELILVKIITRVTSSESNVIKTINQCLGMAACFAIFLTGLLVAGEIAYRVSSPDGAVYEHLAGSFFGLDHLFLNNPIQRLIDSFVHQ